MKTRVAVVSTNLIDPDTNRRGRMLRIRTPEGELMTNRLQQLIRDDLLTTLPSILLEDMHDAYAEIWDSTPEPVLDLALRLLPVTEMQEFYDSDMLWAIRYTTPSETKIWPGDLCQREQFATYLIEGRKILRQRLAAIAELPITEAYYYQTKEIARMQAGVDHLCEFA